MGSGYQFPQSLRSSSFGMVRDPSFSSYLNSVDGQVEVKLAELTMLGNGSEKCISANEEIGVFRADKYFNEGLHSEQKFKESVLKRPIVEGNKDGLVYSPVRSKISLETPSIRSESSSRNSQTALLQGFQTKMMPGRHSTGDINWKKGFWSRISCRCSCVSKKSLNVEHQHFNSTEERKGPQMHRADQLLQVSANSQGKPGRKDSKLNLYPSVRPSFIGRVISSPVMSNNPSPNLHKGGKEGSQENPYPTDSFNTPAIGNIRKSISVERKLNLLNWDKLNTKLEEKNIASTISVEYYTDAESDASSDLFEIDRFTGQRKTSFSNQLPDSSVSGYATPTTCYAPSEASIDWSVVTASAMDLSNLSDSEDFKTPKPELIAPRNRHIVIEKHILNNENFIHILQGSTNHKAGGVLENTDSHKTRETLKLNYHQRMRDGQFVPFSRVQSQPINHPSS